MKRLIIVGSGLAGFAAALEAAERGAEVLLLEKQADVGGASAASGGFLAFAGTELQRQRGIEDSDERLFQDLREVGEFENDEAIVGAYVENQLATYEWLRRQGVEFSSEIETSSGQSVPRVHFVNAAKMIGSLADRCRATGRVQAMTSTRVKRLVRNEDSGRVEGVLAEKGADRIEFDASAGVILASGGFSRNRELVHRFAPLYDNAVFVGAEGNVGDGLRMAWRLGADFRDMAYIKGTYGKHPVDTTNDTPCLAVYKGAIAVNRGGKRYVDESISYKLLGDACMQQAGSSTYQILDHGVFQAGDNRVRIFDFEDRLKCGLMVSAPSLQALAQLIDVPAGTLVETIDRYNGFVTRGGDVDFGRNHLVHNQGELRRIERAPFYAYASTAVVIATYCGLCVDSGMRVLDVFGERIAGLFAAGEVVGGLHGTAYMTGSGLAKAAIFGRIAARSALAQEELLDRTAG